MWLWLNTMGEMPRQEPPQIPIQGRVQLLIPMGQLRALQLILTRVHKPRHSLMGQRHVQQLIPIQELAQPLIPTGQRHVQQLIPIQELAQPLIPMGQRHVQQLILTQEHKQPLILMEQQVEPQLIHILEQGIRHIVGKMVVNDMMHEKSETIWPRFSEF